jgi:hypothetical protein
MSKFLREMGFTPAQIRKLKRASRASNTTSLVRRVTVNRFNKRYPYRETPMSTTNNEFFLASSDVSDHMTTRLLFNRQDKNTLLEEATLLATRQGWSEYVKNRFSTDDMKYKIIHYSSNGMLIINQEDNSWIDASLNANAIDVKVYGTQDEIDAFMDIVGGKFEIAESYVEWMYSTDGQSVNVPLRTDRTPSTEMYPFLKGEAVEDFYDRFLESDASILLLIGPPGTGKTTFIRGFLQHTKSSAIVTYDAAILEKDYVFAQFIENDTNVMVMEDADTFLKARSEGNSMMHRFLNVGDGLVTTKGKKLIFSTNLPSIRDVDSALVRPGRCFDILHFDTLTQDEAEVVAKKAGRTIATKDKWTLAEIFNGDVQKHETKTIGRKVGFV